MPERSALFIGDKREGKKEEGQQTRPHFCSEKKHLIQSEEGAILISE